MKTIKLTLLLFILPIALVTCKERVSSVSNTVQKQTSDVDATAQPIKTVQIKLLNGYFFKNTHNVDANPTFFIFKGEEVFNDYLGMARTMNNQIDKPDFDNNTVLAIVCEPAQVKTEISVIKAEKADENNINIYYEVKTGESLSYSMQPLLVFSFAKEENLKTVNFISDGKTVKTFTLNRRAAGAPTSLEELKDKYTGTFAGTLPCADCSGIETKLTLKKDNTYVLETVYKGKGNKKPYIKKGKWTSSEDLAFIELDYDKKESIYYSLIDGNTLEKLDNHAQPISSNLNYRLIREK